MNLKLRSLLLALPLFSATSALAETTQFDVKGMHCGACVKMIQDKVCKMDGLTKCTVKLGSMSLETKAGQKLDQKKVESLLSEAGEDYKITKAVVKP